MSASPCGLPSGPFSIEEPKPNGQAGREKQRHELHYREHLCRRGLWSLQQGEGQGQGRSELIKSCDIITCISKTTVKIMVKILSTNIICSTNADFCIHRIGIEENMKSQISMKGLAK